MEADTQVSQPEAALLRQAETLAREHRQNGEAARARIGDEAAERLKLAAKREILAAKVEGERIVRRQIQVAESRMAGELDRLRWALTEATLAGVQQAFRSLVADEQRYLVVLEAWLAAAAQALPAGDLIVESRPADQALLAGDWAQIAARAAPGRQVTLQTHGQISAGGIRILPANRRAQIDHTFEGRRARLAEELARAAMERLFASAPNLGTLVHG